MVAKRRKIFLISMVYLLACTGYIYNLYAQSKSIIDENIYNKLYFGALATAAILGDAYHDNLQDVHSKTEQDDWDAINRLTQYNNKVGLTYIYTVIKRNDQIILTSSSASEEELEKKDYVRFFDPYPDASQTLSDAFNSSEPSWVDYTDHWGDFRAVFVPMRSRDGTPYVAGAEISLQEYRSRLKMEAMSHVGIAILFFAAFSLFIALYLLRMRRHLDQTLASEAELQVAKNEAEAAARAKSDFLATMSHEIRTPMNGIIGAAELMLAGELSSTQKKYANIVQASGHSLMTLINDILDFSKIEAGMLVPDNSVFELRPLLFSTIDMVRPNLKGNAVHLYCQIAEDVPEYICCDSQRLRQVLINLIGNAIKFTDKGEIEINVSVLSQEADDRVLRFGIRDSGIGISAEDQQRLFNPFTQVDASSTRRFGGTGLGLAICQRLVTLMGGHIGVTSEPDKGAEFFFTLRSINIAPASPVVREEPDFSDAQLMVPPSHLKILFAEDNPVNQQITLHMLRKLGYEPVMVENGLEAINACHKNQFDIILMDIHMPRMDGLEATRRLRQSALMPQPYIIAFTANAFEAELEKCIAAGMNDCLTKPVRINALAKALNKAAKGIARQNEAAAVVSA